MTGMAFTSERIEVLSEVSLGGRGRLSGVHGGVTAVSAGEWVEVTRGCSGAQGGATCL